MSTQKRAPTPATFKVDPSIEVHKTLYPYLNFKQGGLTPYADSIKRAVASFNPFAVQQVATSDRMAVGMRVGSRWYVQDAYPSQIYFDQHWPSHYNPFADTRRAHPHGVKHVNAAGAELSINFSLLPRFCQRTIATYRRCLIANDQNEKQCHEEQENIISICPNFALDGLKQKKLTLAKLEALNNKKFHSVMEVPEYNRGRSVANVPRSTWADGTATKLRSDSMWIDDRYVDITQAEVDQAKERVQKRNEATGKKVDNSVHLQMYDRTFTNPPTGIPLYP